MRLRSAKIALMANAKQNNPLLPAYLLVGEDALKRQAVLKRLTVRCSQLGDLSFNSDELDGAVSTGEAIAESCNTVPFASDVRMVVVKNAGKLRSADAEKVVAYLKSPNPTTVLAMDAEKLAKNTKLYKAFAAIGKDAVIDCAPPKRKDLPAKVRAMAMNHGATITPGAANVLVDLVGEDTVKIDSELKKIALAHRGSEPINESEVLGLVARTSEVKPWEFDGAFMARDLKRAMLLLSRMPSVSPHALLPRCVNCLRELMATQAVMGRGGAQAVAAVLKKQEWQVKSYPQYARRFTAKELRQALEASCDAERKMKSGADPMGAFTEWLAQTLGR